MARSRDEGERLARPTPATPSRVLARNSRVAPDWGLLLRNRRRACIACWDHIATEPTTPVGKRYEPLKGDQAFCEFRGL